MIERVSVAVQIANGADRLDAELRQRGVVILLVRAPRLDVGIRRRQRVVEIPNAVAIVAAFVAYVSDGPGDAVRQFALNIEIPLPDIAVLDIRWRHHHACGGRSSSLERVAQSQ